MPDSLVLIARCNSLLEAQLLRARLAAAQIEAQLPDESGAAVLGEHFTAVGGIRVWVRQSQAEQARELLEVTAGQEGAVHDPREDAPPRREGATRQGEPQRCPICRTAQAPRRPANPLSLLRRLARGAAAASLTCRVCGHRS